MKKQFPNCLVFLAVIFFASFDISHAFAVKTHVAVANATLDELQQTIVQGSSTNKVIFHGIELDITNAEAYLAIINNSDYFRMGTTGPDALPDIVSGQVYFHVNRGAENASEPTEAKRTYESRHSSTYRSIDYAMRLLGKAKESGDQASIAFALGYIGHCVGDGFAHTYVNEKAGGAWNLTSGSGIFGYLSEEIKHIAVETYIQGFTPDRLENSPTLAQGGTNTGSRLNLAAPYDLLDQFYNEPVFDPCPGCGIVDRVSKGFLFPEYTGGLLYNYFNTQKDIVEYVQEKASTPIGYLKALGPTSPFSAIGITNMLKLGGLNGEMANAITPEILAAFLRRIPNPNPIAAYLDEVDNNLVAHAAKINSYRRNWLVMSKCLMQNTVKGEADFNDNCPEVKDDLTFVGLSGANLTLFRNEINPLFNTPDVTSNSGDYHDLPYNAKRSLKYLESSFKLDDIQEILVPAGIRLAWNDFKDFIKDPVVRAALNAALYVPVTSIQTAVCAAEGGWCEAKCLGPVCAGGYAKCVTRQHDKCKDFATHCVFGLCVTDWVFEYPSCYAANVVVCTGANTVGCVGCGLGCTKDIVQCTGRAFADFDKIQVIEDAATVVTDKIDELVQPIKDYVIAAGCNLARSYGVPVDNLYKFIEVYKSLKELKSSKSLALMNIAFLKEDMDKTKPENQAWISSILSQDLDDDTRNFLTKLSNGDAVGLLGSADATVNEIFPGSIPANCLTFPEHTGIYDGDPHWSVLRSLKILLDTPGPTVVKLNSEMGDDLPSTFTPFYNAVQGHKLLGLTNKADIENFFDKAAASKSNLPWLVSDAAFTQCINPKLDLCVSSFNTCKAACTGLFKNICQIPCNINAGLCQAKARGNCNSMEGLHSHICSDEKTISPFCDAIASLDDPNCMNCLDKEFPTTGPITLDFLNKNIEFNNNTDHWATRRSLAPWNKPGELGGAAFVNTPFLFNSSQNVRENLYIKIFRMEPAPWQAGLNYQVGDKVIYNGIIYEVIAKHMSQSSWVPPYFPNLFKNLLPPQAPKKLEAELGQVSGNANVQNFSNASAGKVVGNLHFGGAKLMLLNIDGGKGGDFMLTLRYSTADKNVKKSLYVNDVKTEQLVFTTTGSWNTFTDMNTRITLRPGIVNSFGINNDPGDDGLGVNLDLFTLTPTEAPVGRFIYEAENGAFGGGGRIQTTSNASGTKVIGNLNTNGAYSEVSGVEGGEGGKKSLLIRYANGYSDTRKLSLYINGNKQQQILFPVTGGWNNFRDFGPINIDLEPNSNNLIKIQRDNGDYEAADIDKYTVGLAANEISYMDQTVITSGPWSNHGSGWKESSTAGATISFDFYGSTVQWISKTFEYGGKGDVYIDGAFEKTISFYNKPLTNSIILFEKTNLPLGIHNIKLVVKNGWNYLELIKWSAN